MLAKSIRIYDITSLATTTPYEGAAFRAHASAVGQSAADAGEPATWTLHRPHSAGGASSACCAGDHSAAVGASGASSAGADPDGGGAGEVAAATWREPVSELPRRVHQLRPPLPAGGAAPHCGHPV